MRVCMESRVITASEDLATFCDSLKGERFITLDTEFIRERTYFPQLCLLQIGSSKEAVAVDPLAEGMDLTPLYRVLADSSILKVFHAAGQDVEIFFRLSGIIPTPIYDTQIAGMVCGFGESASYETLVRELVGAKLDKASRFTDWAKRPLSQRQLDYALDDVIHLRKIFEIMEARIEKDNRQSWIQEEMDDSFSLSRYQIDTQNSWKRLKVKSRDPFYLHMLRAVASWREEMAIKRDVPRQRIIRDEVVLQIAAQTPESIEDLQQVRGLGNNLSRDWQTSLIETLATARTAPKSDFPTPPPRPVNLNAGQEACLDMLRMLLKQACEESHVVPRLVADRDELEALVKGDLPMHNSHLFHGWRYEVFGKKAESLLKGKLHAMVDTSKHGFALKWEEVA